MRRFFFFQKLCDLTVFCLYGCGKYREDSRITYKSSNQRWKSWISCQDPSRIPGKNIQESYQDLARSWKIIQEIQEAKMQKNQNFPTRVRTADLLHLFTFCKTFFGAQSLTSWKILNFLLGILDFCISW